MMAGYRKLGRTELSVSEIGFGGWAIGGESAIQGYGPTNDKISRNAIRAALEMGCNLFDTADCYGMGKSEKILGKELGSLRRETILVTKAGFDFYHGPVRQNFNPAYLRFAVHQSLRRLKTDYIDVFLIHNPPGEVIHNPELIEAVASLKRMGCIRYAGVSVIDVPNGFEAVMAEWVEVIEVPYNMLSPEAELWLLPQAKRQRIGFIAREPLANGFLTGKYSKSNCFFPLGDIRALWSEHLVQNVLDQVESVKPYCRDSETLAQLAIRYVLEASGISSVICGCKSASQVRENFSTSNCYRPFHSRKILEKKFKRKGATDGETNG